MRWSLQLFYYMQLHIKLVLVQGVYIDSNTHKSPLAMNINYYFKLIENTEELIFLEMIVNIALETWLKRL